LGIPGDNTYSNYAEARLAFWEDTVIPLLDLVAADWNAWLAAPDGLELRPDLDQVPAIVEKKARLWEMANASTDLTINERRELKGFQPIDGGDVVLVQSSQISLASAIEPIAPLPDVTPDQVPPELTADDVKAWVYGVKQ
jgi:phage portal protein BeeE